MSASISELYQEASKKYRTASYLYAVTGVVAGAVLIFSLLSFDHTAVNMLIRGVLAILVVVDFVMTVRCTNKADQSKALAEKWRNL